MKDGERVGWKIYPEMRPKENTAWAIARSIAIETMSTYHKSKNPYKMLTHYHANYVNPYWAKTITQMTVIGQHIFYSDPDFVAESAAIREVQNDSYVEAQKLFPNIDAKK